MQITARLIGRLKSTCQGKENHDAEILRTTVNVRDVWEEKIYDYAEAHDMKPCELIRILLNRMVKLMAKLEEFGFRERPMIYQKSGFSYSAMHVSLLADEYSRFKDIMGASRFCLSAILGMAMMIFDELMAEEEENIDSYPKEGYAKYKIVNNTMEIYVNCWIERGKKQKHPPSR